MEGIDELDINYQIIWNTLYCEREAEIIARYFSQKIKKEAHSFFFELNKGYSLSISVPPMIMGNKIKPSVGQTYPLVIETAIFYKGKYKSVEEWGYFDVNLFHGMYRASERDNIKKIQEEIKRLLTIINK